MEETTIMNTKYLATRIASCLLGLLCLAGCTEQELPVTPPTGQGQGLCFAVKQADTKMSYDNVRSNFEAGDTIGCVITVNDEYKANSAWHYNAANGMLILDYIWGTKQNQWGNQGYTLTRVSHNDNANNTLISRDNDPEGTTGFIDLLMEGTYDFYFYYPYVASDLLREDVADANNSYKALAYPNILTNDFTSSPDVYTQCYVTGEVRESGQAGASWSKTFTTYTWTSYPSFANHTQASKAQINNSDFLWTKRTGITSASNQTVNLVFQKKMATIEVVSDTPLADVYFQAQSAGSLRRGKIIDLSTGTLSDYTYSTEWNATLLQRNCYFTTSEQIQPYNNSADGTDYRLVLPAQDAFLCNLHFTLNGAAHTIDLSDNISNLSEGTLYIIHINRRGETTLEIVDWENEHYEILDPDTNAETVNH